MTAYFPAVLASCIAGVCSFLALSQAVEFPEPWSLAAPGQCGDEASFRRRLREARASSELTLRFSIEEGEEGFEGRLEIRRGDSAQRSYYRAEACDTLIRSVVVLLADGAVPEGEPVLVEGKGSDEPRESLGKEPGVVPKATEPAESVETSDRGTFDEAPPEGEPPAMPEDRPSGLHEARQGLGPSRHERAWVCSSTRGSRAGWAPSCNMRGPGSCWVLQSRAAFRVAIVRRGSSVQWSRVELLPRVGVGRGFGERWSGSAGLLGALGVEFAGAGVGRARLE